MGSEKTDQLTPAEAKDRLRQAVAELGLGALVKQRPVATLSFSFVAGLILASSRPLQRSMMRMLLQIL